MHVKIVGGKSACGRISILSDEFTSTAFVNDEGEISCEVKRHPSLMRFLYSKKSRLMPRVLKMALFFTEGLTKKFWAFFCLYLLGFVITIKYPLAEDHSSLSVFFTKYGWAVSLAIFSVALFYIRRYIATWHGAEHMAIAAYERNNSVILPAIARESPIHNKCGGRLVLPMIVCAEAMRFTAQSFGLNSVIAVAIGWECALWVDTLKGWDKIPVTSQVSRLLQKWITTKKPGMFELLTAQRALQELVAAHHAPAAAPVGPE